MYTLHFKDISLKEFLVLIPLFFLVLFMGFYPSFFSAYLDIAVYNMSIINFSN